MGPHHGGAALGAAGSDRSNVVDNWGEVGGSGELQLWQHPPVGFNDALDSCNNPFPTKDVRKHSAFMFFEPLSTSILVL